MINQIRLSCAAIGVPILLAFSGSALAANWVAVTDTTELKALFSDTAMTATLKDGVQASARYMSDGTGELEAWGGTFPGQWKVEFANPRSEPIIPFVMKDGEIYRNEL